MLSTTSMKIGAKGALKVASSAAREMSHIAPAAISPYMVEAISHGMRPAARQVATPPAFAANRLARNLGEMRSMSTFPLTAKTLHSDLATRNDNPFDPFRFFQDDFFRDDFFRSPFMMMSSPRSHMLRPSFNVSEDEHIFQLHMDVPGVKADDLHVDVTPDDRVLSLSGERKYVGEDKSEASTFKKSFVLDKNININDITADLKNGVMTITAPKIHQEPQKAIKIHVADEDKKGSLPDEVLRDENESEIYETTGKKVQVE